MMKYIKKAKGLLVVIVVLILGIGGYGIYREFNPIVMSSEGDLYVAKDLTELEENSELIVKVKATDKANEYVETDPADGTPIYGHTLTELEILDVISGDSAALSDVLTVYEPYYHYKVFGVQNYLMTTENYKPLTPGNEYVLFLKKAPSVGENVYYIVSSQYGKFLYTETNVTSKSAKNLDIYETDEHYLELYGEVSSKYMN